MQTRREFIKSAALLSGAIGAWGTLGASIRRAMAIEPEPGSSFLDAEHVVILMQENRSFDHCFGSLRGVRGFNDPRAIHLPNGNPVWLQTDSSGRSFLPFRLNIKDTQATWMGCLPHNWESQADARNHGMCDQWLEAKRPGNKEHAAMPLTMGHYTREDIPFYYQLADAFTVCDQYFSSSLTDTTPNRLYLWTGTIRAQQSSDAQANVAKADVDYGQPGQWTTFPERLEDHGISWKLYQNELSVESGLTGEEHSWLANFHDNPLEFFTQFNVKLSKVYRDHLERQSQLLPGAIAQLKQQLARGGLSADEAASIKEELEKPIRALNHVLSERETWNAEKYAALSAREKNLHEKAFCTNVGDPAYRQLVDFTYMDGAVQRRLQLPKGDVLHQFRRDVEAGCLPAVSWLAAPERFSDHPASPWYGAWYISEAMNILTQNPQVWKKTIFILLYDENDGYFDHVPPFAAPHPHQSESGFASKGIDTSLDYVELEQDRKRVPPGPPRESPIGLGFRVPMIIASPWSRGGCVCSQVFDHTSVLQFLEKFLSHKTGIAVTETNISGWRRSICGDLTSAFQSVPKEDPPLRFARLNQVVAGIHGAKFKPLPTGYTALREEQIEQLRQSPLESPLMPRQEPGVRPSSPLPYELYVDGAMNLLKGQFTIRFAAGKNCFGDQSAGCPFTVYAMSGKGSMKIRNYAVSAGDRIEDSWDFSDLANENYHLRVYGPNGFYREFRGNSQESPAEVRLSYSHRASGGFDGNLQIAVTNHAGRALPIEVSNRSYQREGQKKSVAPGQTAIFMVNTQPSFHWYDVSVAIAQLDGFRYRFAGRVETGEWTFSDPAMGNV